MQGMGMNISKMAVRRWTWQWLVVISILLILGSCAVVYFEEPYVIDEETYNPNKPWKQMIWEASVAVAKERRDNA